MAKSGNKRVEYTQEERDLMVKYIISNKCYEELRGNTIWKELEATGTINHPWQSLREHFKKKIIENIYAYDISAIEKQRIKKGWDRSSCSTFRNNEENCEDKTEVIIIESDSSKEENISNKMEKKKRVKRRRFTADFSEEEDEVPPQKKVSVIVNITNSQEQENENELVDVEQISPIKSVYTDVSDEINNSPPRITEQPLDLSLKSNSQDETIIIKNNDSPTLVDDIIVIDSDSIGNIEDSQDEKLTIIDLDTPEEKSEISLPETDCIDVENDNEDHSDNNDEEPIQIEIIIDNSFDKAVEEIPNALESVNMDFNLNEEDKLLVEFFRSNRIYLKKREEITFYEYFKFLYPQSSGSAEELRNKFLNQILPNIQQLELNKDVEPDNIKSSDTQANNDVAINVCEHSITKSTMNCMFFELTLNNERHLFVSKTDDNFSPENHPEINPKNIHYVDANTLGLLIYVEKSRNLVYHTYQNILTEFLQNKELDEHALSEMITKLEDCVLLVPDDKVSETSSLETSDENCNLSSDRSEDETDSFVLQISDDSFNETLDQETNSSKNESETLEKQTNYSNKNHEQTLNVDNFDLGIKLEQEEKEAESSERKETIIAGNNSATNENESQLLIKKNESSNKSTNTENVDSGSNNMQLEAAKEEGEFTNQNSVTNKTANTENFDPKSNLAVKEEESVNITFTSTNFDSDSNSTTKNKELQNKTETDESFSFNFNFLSVNETVNPENSGINSTVVGQSEFSNQSSMETANYDSNESDDTFYNLLSNIINEEHSYSKYNSFTSNLESKGNTPFDENPSFLNSSGSLNTTNFIPNDCSTPTDKSNSVINDSSTVQQYSSHEFATAVDAPSENSLNSSKISNEIPIQPEIKIELGSDTSAVFDKSSAFQTASEEMDNLNEISTDVKEKFKTENFENSENSANSSQFLDLSTQEIVRSIVSRLNNDSSSSPDLFLSANEN